MDMQINNSEVDALIRKTFKSETEQNIVRDRLIKCLTFDEIISSNFPNISLSDKSKQKFISLKITSLLNRFYQAASSFS